MTLGKGKQGEQTDEDKKTEKYMHLARLAGRMLVEDGLADSDQELELDLKKGTFSMTLVPPRPAPAAAPAKAPAAAPAKAPAGSKQLARCYKKLKRSADGVVLVANDDGSTRLPNIVRGGENDGSTLLQKIEEVTDGVPVVTAAAVAHAPAVPKAFKPSISLKRPKPPPCRPPIHLLNSSQPTSNPANVLWL